MELCAFKRNNFLFNKLLPCLIITMFAIMCLYGSSVYASNSLIFSDETFPIGDGFNDYYSVFFVGYDDYEQFYYIQSVYSSSPITAEKINDSYYTLHFTAPYTNSLYSGPTLNTNFFNISSLSTPASTATSTTFGHSFRNNSTSSFVFCSNCDVLDYNDNSNVVFQAPSQAQPTIVASQVGEVEMNKTLQEILGILPVVIVVLVGLIAIRKGIQFLMARMKKA